MAVYRYEEGGDSQQVGPLSLVPIVRAQGSGAEITVHGREALAVQKAMHPRSKLLEQFNLPGAISFKFRSTLEEALAEFKDSSLDEITMRVPEMGMSQIRMESLAKTMLEKLNVDGTQHPKGANVLIGLRNPARNETDFAKVFEKVAKESGLQVEEVGVFPVAGQGRPARLMFLKR